jgi:general stress protein 26
VPTQVNLFFIANNASHKFDEIKHDSNVNVSFYDQKTTGWASVSGVAKISQDKDLIKKFWSSTFVCDPCTLCDTYAKCSNRITSFFGDLKDGKHDGSSDDPRVSLIEVVPSEIHYWVSTSSSISRTAEITYGALTGKARAPGEPRMISDAEVCRCQWWVSVSLIIMFPTIDQTSSRLE